MKIIIPNSLDEIQKWVASKIEKRKEFRICGQGTRFVDSNLKKASGAQIKQQCMKTQNIFICISEGGVRGREIHYCRGLLCIHYWLGLAWLACIGCIGLHWFALVALACIGLHWFCIGFALV